MAPAIGIGVGVCFAGNVPGYTPLDLGSKLKLWLPSTIAAQTVDGSANVETWSDASGNGNHFGQSTAGVRPAQVMSGAIPWVSFESSGSEYLISATNLLAQLNSSTFSFALTIDRTVASPTFQAGITAATPRLYCQDAAYSYDSLNTCAFAAAPTKHVLEFGHDGSNAYVMRGASALSSVAIAVQGAFASTPLWIGRAANTYGTFRCADVILTVPTMTTAERAQWLAYVARRHGI